MCICLWYGITVAHKTIWRGWFSPFTMWVLGIKLIVRFGGKHLSLPSHLAGSVF